MKSDSEPILPSADPSFQTAFANLDMSRDGGIQVETVESELESEDKGPPSPLAREPARLAAQSSFDLLASA